MEGTAYLHDIRQQMERHSGRTALHIRGRDYSYADLAGAVSHIQSELPGGIRETGYAGLLLGDDLQTYASILALWFSGVAFIPVNPLFPDERNRAILEETRPGVLLASDPGKIPGPAESLPLLDTSEAAGNGGGMPRLEERPPGRDAYVLFTSGSTGRPKGVRITFRNLDAFVRDFIAYPAYDFSEADRFLQIYDLSFDASVHCYTVPLACGAAVYTVPPEGIKFLDAYRLMREHSLTFAKMPPSTLAYLKPHFDSIRLPSLKYCLFGGEAFPVSLVEEWERCVPGALIQNVYGPTEVTINCLIYEWNGPDSTRKQRGGTASIGKGFGSNRVRVVNDMGEEAGPGESGELWVAGEQVSPGYWERTDMEREAFVERDEGGLKTRFYRTGDRVVADGDGDVMFLGRNDEQVQVRGYRVELGEIESAARELAGGLNVRAFVREPEPGRQTLLLAVESESLPPRLREGLAGRLPSYMVPEQFVPVPEFPKLVSGKTDRDGLMKMLPG